MEMWWFLFLGHLIGDYIFQWDKIAQNKSKKGWVGTKACLTHCIEYSLIVCLCLFSSGCLSLAAALIFFPIVFLTHYPIDRVSFAKWWLKNYNRKILPVSPKSITPEGIIEYDAGVFFYWLVYIAIDNTLHLVFMTIGLGILVGIMG